jgi:hypothetical protein
MHGPLPAPLLVLQVSNAAALSVGVGLLGIATLGAAVTSREPAPWHAPRG